MSTRTNTVEVWHGCFDDSWRDIITPDAFAHPAKFSRGLIERIITHGLSVGWFHPGDIIGDPFGGIGTGGIISAYHGLAWKGVELEPRFCKLAKHNFDLHVARWNVLGAPLPELFQGDSRKFASIIGAASAVVTSPPYADTPIQGGGANAFGAKKEYDRTGVWPKGNLARTARDGQGYGETLGQIGDLKSGDISAVATSPHYNKPFSQDHNGSRGGQRSLGNAPSSEAGAFVCYGHTEADSLHLNESREVQEDRMRRKGQFSGIEKMAGASGSGNQGYGATDGNLGNIGGETYWQAMAQVYAQCFIALRPGGMACINVKDYVKDKARIPLCEQTLTLLQHVGFETVTRIHAMLVKEHRTDGLFCEIVKQTARKSFFRRLAESKGSPKIDWEEVLVVRKPNDNSEMRRVHEEGVCLPI